MISEPKLPYADGANASADITNTPASASPTPDLWIRRLAVLFFVFVCATLGVLLLILPWRPEWSENPLLLSWPALHQLAIGGFARGLVTGLGVLNIWLGFWEAVKYRED